MDLRRLAAVSLLTAAVFAQTGSADRAFTTIPFDDWVTEKEQPPLRWKLQVSRPVLSEHQRLLVRVDARIDGVELARRRGRGDLEVYLQVLDAEGRRYQDHGNIDLKKVEEGVKASDIDYSEFAFVVPGEYRVAVALRDTATGDHWGLQDKLHVPALRNDPLPDAWRGLPAVEIVPALDPPDSWYLPSLEGRLHLEAAPRHPARIDVVANLTPSERESGSIHARQRNLATIIPALKIFAQTNYGNAPLDVALLDIESQRTVFHQENVRQLDWPDMRDALTAGPAGTIDVRALEHRSGQAAFFATEIGRRLASGEAASAGAPARVVIVLSAAVAFESGQDPRPAETLAPGARLYYIRFSWPVLRLPRDGPMQRHSRTMGRAPSGMPQVDQLAGTLKRFAPHIFDVASPEQFRKALAAILADIARL